MSANEQREKQREKRCAYMREWRSKNRDKIREQKRVKSRYDALAALASVKQLDVNVFIMRAQDGREYIIGGRKK